MSLITLSKKQTTRKVPPVMDAALNFTDLKEHSSPAASIINSENFAAKFLYYFQNSRVSGIYKPQQREMRSWHQQTYNYKI